MKRAIFLAIPASILFGFFLRPSNAEFERTEFSIGAIHYRSEKVAADVDPGLRRVQPVEALHDDVDDFARPLNLPLCDQHDFISR